MFKDNIQLLDVLLNCGDKHNNVIQICKTLFSWNISKYTFHQSLKCVRGVGQAKWHYIKLKVTFEVKKAVFLGQQDEVWPANIPMPNPM